MAGKSALQTQHQTTTDHVRLADLVIAVRRTADPGVRVVEVIKNRYGATGAVSAAEGARRILSAAEDLKGFGLAPVGAKDLSVMELVGELLGLDAADITVLEAAQRLGGYKAVRELVHIGAPPQASPLRLTDEDRAALDRL